MKRNVDAVKKILPTVDIVAHEQVVGVGWLATDLEQLHQVVELAVNVTAHGHRAFDRLKSIILVWWYIS